MKTRIPAIKHPDFDTPSISNTDVGQKNGPITVSIVGIDGCGKSSTFRDAMKILAPQIRIAGVGDQVWSGGPGDPLHQRLDIPQSRLTQSLDRIAKGIRRPSLYKRLKFLELTERTRLRDYLAAHDAPNVILNDGDSMVNSAAWAVARYYRSELTGDDEKLYEALRYLTGEDTIPLRDIPYYARRAWPLVLLNRLHTAHFTYPQLIYLLDIDPAIALARIRARGRQLQPHETEEFLGELGRAYERVCTLLEQRRRVPVIRLRVDQMDHEETVQRVVDTTLAQIRTAGEQEITHVSSLDRIDVIATTMSGSIKDQRKVNRIVPEFQSRTSRPVRVYPADSHAEAQAIAHQIVRGGSRLLVSAGGAGTFNAVLEGAHVAGKVPSDLRLAFLRKGSADLIGKVLGIPDQLPDAVHAIVGGIEQDAIIDADVLEVQALGIDGQRQYRHIVGFGGFGLFGDVPRFTESRLIKVYKGVLGTLFGDLGPFFVGLAIASIYWQIKYLLGRQPALSLTLDDDEMPPTPWGAVVLLNGDLGPDFPLGCRLNLSSGSFRVVALLYQGPRRSLRQILACRTGKVLNDPERYGALVRTVRRIVVRPENSMREFMVNVDGLKMMVRGDVMVSVSGTVHLVAGRLEGD